MHATAPAATANPIDALAVARAALREPDLPTARLGPAREVRLLVSHREDLVAERTRIINRLRWHLHELNPSWQPPARSLWRPKHLATTTARLQGIDGLVAAWPTHSSSVAGCLATRSPSSTESWNPWSGGSLRRCSNCAASRR